MKILKYFIISIVFLFLAVVVLIQYKAEAYRIKQAKEYNILKDRRRISYCPAFIYYINHKNKPAFFAASSILYDDLNLKIIRCARIGDEYIVKCFYSRKEIEKFLAQQNN